jgi:hypothetical protein
MGDDINMILDVGEKVHIIEKRNFTEDVRRHFIGEVVRCTDNNVRIKGFVWIYEQMQQSYIRYPEKRERIISLEGDLIINVLPESSIISDITYSKEPGKGLVVKAGQQVLLTINEFGSKQ